MLYNRAVTIEFFLQQRELHYTRTNMPENVKNIRTPPTSLIGVRAGGARGAAAPPKFGQLRFFGQQEEIWAKPVFKDVSMFFIIIT